MLKALLDATSITDMRTGAMTAIGAKHLARKDSKILGHIGARGTAYWNVRLLDHLFDFDEIRVHSRRLESREAFGARLARDLGKPVTVTDTISSPNTTCMQNSVRSWPVCGPGARPTPRRFCSGIAVLALPISRSATRSCKRPLVTTSASRFALPELSLFAAYLQP